MLKDFIPDHIYDDIYSIDYDKLYTKGIRLLIFDIDGTILKSLNFSVTDKLVDLFVSLKIMGFTITLLTNAGNLRLDPVLAKTNITHGIASAKKPNKSAFEKVTEQLYFSKEKTAMIGNDLYADIFGANQFGITSIFVGSLDLSIMENKINNFILKKARKFKGK
ncbi:MAG: HAD hydrolase-like protein [Bacilli bacterium]|nr:HAD hydrolase-like protein [Bacilli bacterium]